MESRALWRDKDGDLWVHNRTGPSCACFSPRGWDWDTNFGEDSGGGWSSLSHTARHFQLEVLIPKEYME